MGLLAATRADILLESGVDFIREHAARGEVLVVAPTHDAADDLARRAAAGALLGVHRTTVDHLAAALAQRELHRREFAPLSRIAQEALAARAVRQLRGENRLHYFEPVAAYPGFPRALARTLNDLRLGHVGYAELVKQPGAAQDLAELLVLYEAELDFRRLADQRTRFAVAREVAEQRGHPFCGLPMLLLDVPVRTAAAREFLLAVMQQAEHASVMSQVAVAADWERMLGVDAVRVEVDVPLAGARATHGTELSSAQTFLFSREVIPPREPDGSCQLFAAPGPAMEAVEIARALRDAARGGMPFDAMAVLMRRPAQYQPVMEEAFRRAGIPAYYTRGSRRPDAGGRAFLSLLHFAVERFPATRFAEYLSLGQAPNREDGELHTPAGWERMIVDASVVGGKDRWERRLNGLEEQLRTAPEDDESALRRLDRLLALREFVLPLIERLSDLPKLAPWEEWLFALSELAPLTLRRPEPVLELLDELRILAGSEPVELGGVIHTLEEHLRFLREAPGDERYGRVLVAGIEEARGMSFQLVAVPGLNEGDFPRQISGDPLLADDRKQALGLAVQDEREEQLLLHTALACASARVLASYSEVDLLSGRKRVLSLYAAELMKAARGSTLDIRKLEQEALSAVETRAGWPAPKRASDAIDAAEFDLASLRDAVDGGKPGAGAYLTKVNEHLVRSLRARGRRWRERWFPEDGLVNPDIETLKILERHRLTNRDYSTSALQHYAVCPYRFALRAIYGLRPAERPAPLERMDPAVRGSLYHETQFEFLRELQQRGWLPVEARRSHDARSLLGETLRRTAAAYAEKLAPAIPYVWTSEVEAIHADLRGWLNKLSERDPGWLPFAFELSFGLTPDARHDARSSAEAVSVPDVVRLRGSIDLVERHTSGLLRVIDHKTGVAPTPLPQCVGKGEMLQPVLYALAAEKMLGEKVVTGRLHYATLRANFREVDIPMTDFTRSQGMRALEFIDEALRTGFLPAAPREDACETCDYRVVCGPYEELRTKRKSKAETKPLRELRAMK